MKIKVIKLTHFLGQVPTIYYVILYFVSILIFATIYYYLPLESFYHGTSKYERLNLNSQRDELMNSIEKDVRINFENYYAANENNLKWIIDTNDIWIFDFSFDENYNSFNINVDVKTDNKKDSIIHSKEEDYLKRRPWIEGKGIKFGSVN